jgi:hypothetical protein
MSDGGAAVAVLVVHFGFICFVALGGLMAWKWPGIAWLHLPAALWGAWIEFSGSICPLTPLEKAFLSRAGEASYTGDFLAHYLLSWIYPSGLTRAAQCVLGLLVVAVNAALYGLLWRRLRKRAGEGKA